MGRAFWIPVGVLLWAGIAAPTLGLSLDYSIDDAFFLAALYFYFFVFAALFGPFLVYALIRPFSLIMRYYAAQGRRGVLPLLLMIGVPLFTTPFVWLIETPAGEAPWQLNSAALTTPRLELANQAGQAQSILGVFKSLKDDAFLRRLTSDRTELSGGNPEKAKLYEECPILGATVTRQACLDAKARFESVT